MKRKESKFINDQSKGNHGLESIFDYLESTNKILGTIEYHQLTRSVKRINLVCITNAGIFFLH